MINISNECCGESQNTHVMFNFLSENRVVHEIMWNNSVEPEKPQMTGNT
jgi:hypothetical protein